MTADGLQKLVGKKSTPIVFEVNRTDIRKIADAAGDRNPLYWDDEYAGNSPYGGVIAPPDFFGWPVKWAPGQPFVYSNDLAQQIFTEVINAGYTRAINAGMESEYFCPVRPGDTIIISNEVISVEEKEGKKGGKMVIVIVEATMINQNGDLVAKQRHSTIH